MKITSQLLRKHAVGALEDAQYIDLSDKRIAVIEHLEECHKLQTLILQHNNIDSIRNVDCCSELWTIDMTGNMLKSLNGLSQFPVLGSLILSNNELDWQELKKLSHAHTLSLILTGNEKLVSDNHYRKHVIDVLPHLWMLDGLLITAGERKRVLHFFEKSASSLQPVRHKSNTRSVFIPSSRKHLLVTGVFGERTTVLMTKFPLQEVHNIDLDRRRLSHLTVLMEEDLKIESDYMKRKGQSSFIVPGLCRLLEIRVKETEQCNMLLLLLVAMLEFDLPHGLMLATIDTAKLGFIGDVRCQDIISLPPQVILKVISVLISAAAIDKDDNKDGGLYLQLYQCLQAIVYSLHGKVHSITTHMDIQQSTPSRSTTPTFSTTSSTLFTSSRKSSSSSSQYTHQRCLLASEVVHLMCLVPTFFDLLDSNKGIVDMVAVATRNQYVANVISHIKWTVYNDGGNIWDIYHEMASYLLQTTTSNVFRKRKALPASSSSSSSSSSNPNSLRHTSSQIIQTPRRSSHLPPPRAQSAGAVASFRRRHPTPNQPDLGDFVLCAPERLARIVALPETYVAVLQLSSSAHNSSVAPDSYFYTDTRGLIWDGTQGHWTKDDLTCDLSAGRLYTYSDITDTIHNPNSRPVSQLSCISEDLQTIPSVEELNLDDDTVELKDEVDKEDGREEVTVRGDLKEDNDKEIEFSLRVDISSREGLIPPRSNTPEEIEATLQHQQTVLQHYSLSQCSIDKHETEKEDELTHPFSAKKEWMTNKQVSIEEDENIDQLTIPIPKLNHLETWESTKSLPQSVFSSSPPKPHSCNKVDVSSKYPSRDEVEKRLSSTIDMSPFHKRQSRPLLVHAWTTVKSGHPKQTMLSSTRMANRSSKISPSLSISYQTSQDSVISRHLPPSSSYSSSLVHEPHHMTTYNTHARMLKNKYQFQPKKLTASTKGHSSPRKLGDVHSLSVLGASVW